MYNSIRVIALNISLMWKLVGSANFLPQPVKPYGLSLLGSSLRGILKSRSEMPCPPPGAICYPAIKPAYLTFPALVDAFFTTNATWVPRLNMLETL